MNAEAIEKRKEYMRKYQREHKDRINAQARERRNKARIQYHITDGENECKDKFVSRIRLLIGFAGSQELFGNRIGVSRQVIMNYVNGTSLPSAQRLVRIADEFNVTTDWLLGRSDEEQQLIREAREKRINEIDNELEKLQRMKDKLLNERGVLA